MQNLHMQGYNLCDWMQNLKMQCYNLCDWMQNFQGFLDAKPDMPLWRCARHCDYDMFYVRVYYMIFDSF